MSLPGTGCGEGPEPIINGADEKALENDAVAREALQIIEELEMKLQAKTEECEALKKQNSRLELDVVEANMKTSCSTSEQEDVHKMKADSEEIITRAKSIIFEKTKVCKNQELQIEALGVQVSSLKDVVSITKNLLEIRNMEVKHLQDQIQCMNDKVSAEKERQDLVHSKLEKMIRLNADLKREYETQLCLFNALRERYNERELARDVVGPRATGTVNREAAAGTVNGEAAATNTSTPVASTTSTAESSNASTTADEAPKE